MPFKEPGKITFKGKIDPRLIPTDAAPGYEIVDLSFCPEVLLFGGTIRIDSCFFRFQVTTPDNAGLR
jgi:hypothetical protein